MKIKTGSYCKACREALLKYKDLDKATAFINKIHVKGYGNVSEKRIAEMQRRVIVPGATDGEGGYVIGRRSDSGKVQENREPNY